MDDSLKILAGAAGGVIMGAGATALLPAPEAATVPTIEAYQQAYFNETGKYAHVEVNTYQTPLGESGYEIVHHLEDGSISSKGYGPEANTRTFFIPKETPTATTTP